MLRLCYLAIFDAPIFNTFDNIFGFFRVGRLLVLFLRFSILTFAHFFRRLQGATFCERKEYTRLRLRTHSVRLKLYILGTSPAAAAMRRHYWCFLWMQNANLSNKLGGERAHFECIPWKWCLCKLTGDKFRVYLLHLKQKIGREIKPGFRCCTYKCWSMVVVAACLSQWWWWCEEGDDVSWRARKTNQTTERAHTQKNARMKSKCRRERKKHETALRDAAAQRRQRNVEHKYHMKLNADAKKFIYKSREWMWKSVKEGMKQNKSKLKSGG